MTGGSGLFLDAVCNGLDALPQTDPEIRETLNKKHLEEGLLPLQQMLREADPAYYEKVDINNPQRVIRALEVFISSGKPYSSFLKAQPHHRPFRTVRFAIDLDRPHLYQSINERVTFKIPTALVEEAQKINPNRTPTTPET